MTCEYNEQTNHSKIDDPHGTVDCIREYFSPQGLGEADTKAPNARECPEIRKPRSNAPLVCTPHVTLICTRADLPESGNLPRAEIVSCTGNSHAPLVPSLRRVS